MVIEREKTALQIKESLLEIEKWVEADRTVGHLNSALRLESFYLHFLKLVYGWNLVNANSQETRNQDSFDLYDREQRIAVQVTITVNAKKIKKTLNTFVGKHDAEFDRLVFAYPKFEIGKSRANFELAAGGFDFNAERDRLGFGKAFSQIMDLPIERQQDISQLLSEEVGRLTGTRKRRHLLLSGTAAIGIAGLSLLGITFRTASSGFVRHADHLWSFSINNRTVLGLDRNYAHMIGLSSGKYELLDLDTGEVAAQSGTTAQGLARKLSSARNLNYAGELNSVTTANQLIAHPKETLIIIDDSNDYSSLFKVTTSNCAIRQLETPKGASIRGLQNGALFSISSTIDPLEQSGNKLSPSTSIFDVSASLEHEFIGETKCFARNNRLYFVKSESMGGAPPLNVTCFEQTQEKWSNTFDFPFSNAVFCGDYAALFDEENDFVLVDLFSGSTKTIQNASFSKRISERDCIGVLKLASEERAYLVIEITDRKDVVCVWMINPSTKKWTKIGQIDFHTAFRLQSEKLLGGEVEDRYLKKDFFATLISLVLQANCRIESLASCEVRKDRLFVLLGSELFCYSI